MTEPTEPPIEGSQAGPGHHHGSMRSTQRSALWWALGANLLFLFAEIVGGIVFGSLALLADAAHMFSDVVGLAIALVAQRLLDRPATSRHSFGLQRAEVLGAQANAVTLVAVAVWIVYEAVGRLGEPGDVQAPGLLVVAVLGLAVNIGSALILARARGGSLNMQGAYVHMVADAAGSVGVIVSALAILWFDANWVDPAVSIAIAGMVLWSAWGLLRDTANVLLEGAPKSLDPVEIERVLRSQVSVEGVHHLHLWSLASDVPALSAHVVLAGEMSLDQAQERGSDLRVLLHDRFGIEHATLELESFPCEGPDCSDRGRH